jgi:hypothetical protein
MPRAKRSSAEWIMEAPASGRILPLANFGTITFNNCYAVLNGYNSNQPGSINYTGWQYDAITMVTSSGIPKATPGPLYNNGTSFDVVWNHN